MISIDLERWKVIFVSTIFFHSNPCPHLTLTTTLTIHIPPLTLAVISVGVPYLYVSVSKASNVLVVEQHVQSSTFWAKTPYGRCSHSGETLWAILVGGYSTRPK